MALASIAGKVDATLKDLYTVTATLFTFIISAENVANSLKNLRSEVQGLIRVFEAIKTFLEYDVKSETNAVWGTTYKAIKDTESTIKVLQSILHHLGPAGIPANGIKNAIKQKHLNIDSNEIVNIISRIQLHSIILRKYNLNYAILHLDHLSGHH